LFGRRYDLTANAGCIRRDAEDEMETVAMTLGLIFLTVGAGCLLWSLLLHFEEIHAAEDSEFSHPKRVALLFLGFAGLMVVGTLAILLVEVQQLFTAGS